MTEKSIQTYSVEELREAFDRSFSLPPDTGVTDKQQVLVFSLADEYYSIPLHFIREVLKIPRITKVPCAPAILYGVINLNGEIISVSDIRYPLDLPRSELTPAGRIIITKNLRFTTGIITNDINGILAVGDDDIQPPLSTLDGDKKEFIQGEFYAGKRLVILLDMERLTSSPEMKIG